MESWRLKSGLFINTHKKILSFCTRLQTSRLLRVASCSRRRLCAKGHLDRWEAVRLTPETTSKKWWQAVTRKSSWVHWVKRQEWPKSHDFCGQRGRKDSTGSCVHWWERERERGGGGSVNGDCYLKLLQDRVWPLFRSYAIRRNLWWMQDGAPPHCASKDVLTCWWRAFSVSLGFSYVY